MNIDDVSITKVYIVYDIEHKPNYIHTHHAKYTRTTLVLRKEKNDTVKYYDLLYNRYVKHDLYYCDVGEEVINIEKMCIRLVDAVGYTGFKHISKRKIKKLVKNLNL